MRRYGAHLYPSDPKVHPSVPAMSEVEPVRAHPR